MSDILERARNALERTAGLRADPEVEERMRVRAVLADLDERQYEPDPEPQAMSAPAVSALTKLSLEIDELVEEIGAVSGEHEKRLNALSAENAALRLELVDLRILVGELRADSAEFKARQAHAALDAATGAKRLLS